MLIVGEAMCAEAEGLWDAIISAQFYCELKTVFLKAYFF